MMSVSSSLLRGVLVDGSAVVKQSITGFAHSSFKMALSKKMPLVCHPRRSLPFSRAYGGLAI